MGIKAKVSILEITYSVKDEFKDACQFLTDDTSCPIEAEKEHAYELVMPLESPLTNINTRISISLYDALGRVVVCFAFDAHIAP